MYSSSLERILTVQRTSELLHKAIKKVIVACTDRGRSNPNDISSCYYEAKECSYVVVFNYKMSLIKMLVKMNSISQGTICHE